MGFLCLNDYFTKTGGNLHINSDTPRNGFLAAFSRPVAEYGRLVLQDIRVRGTMTGCPPATIHPTSPRTMKTSPVPRAALLAALFFTVPVHAVVPPPSDPAPERTLSLRPGYLTEHPRILFTKAEAAKIRSFAKSPAGKPYLDRLDAYWRSSLTVPGDRKFLKDATDAQRHFLWRLPSLALHYVVEEDDRSLNAVTGFLRMLNDLPHWETGGEEDCGMGCANVMIGAAIAFDTVYDKLDPAFRETFRETLWRHARAMFYGGHKGGCSALHYWQGDPLNNHRWHRDGGLLLCALAAATGDASERWLLDQCVKDLEFVVSNLPPDGSHHESGSYLMFGASHLVLALDASDRAFGTKFLEAPFFKNVGLFRMHTLLPGMKDAFSYGDGQGIGGYGAFLYKAAARNRLPALVGALDTLREAAPGAFEFAWFDLLWIDPQLRGTSNAMAMFPKTGLFPNLGALFVRDSWKDDAVAAMFKCGPFGGYTLNRFRDARNFQYINVAHDDPDANSFVLAMGGGLVAETDRYSEHKRSANHNTVLVNGIGQEAKGRPEGGGWTQPATGGSMADMAYLTGWKNVPGCVIVEGEASGSYPAVNRRGVSRPALQRFRRTFVWLEGKYILVLDDLRAPSPVSYEWLLQGRDIRVDDAEKRRFTLVNGATECPVQIAATEPLAISFRTSSADNHGRPLGWKQLDAKAEARDVRIASVYTPWGGNAELVLVKTNDKSAKIGVRHNGRTDTWTWESASSEKVPGRLLFNARPVLGPQDLPPKPL